MHGTRGSASYSRAHAACDSGSPGIVFNRSGYLPVAAPRGTRATHEARSSSHASGHEHSVSHSSKTIRRLQRQATTLELRPTLHSPVAAGDRSHERQHRVWTKLPADARRRRQRHGRDATRRSVESLRLLRRCRHKLADGACRSPQQTRGVTRGSCRSEAAARSGMPRSPSQDITSHMDHRGQLDHAAHGAAIDPALRRGLAAHCSVFYGRANLPTVGVFAAFTAVLTSTLWPTSIIRSA